VMWEVMERRIPYETNEGFPESMVGAIGEIRGGVRPVVGEGCEEFGGGVVGLMRRCWSGEGGDRPTFGEVVEELGLLRRRCSLGGEGGGDVYLHLKSGGL
jgi:hypothetical protein